MIKYWITKDREKIAIKDMSLEHIANAKNMLLQLRDKDPGEQFYVGESWGAESAVDSENRYNEELRMKIDRFIEAFEREVYIR